MKAKHIKLSFIATSLFMISSMVNAETVSINPLAMESYSKEFNVSAQEAERRLTITSKSDYIAQKMNEQFGDSIESMYFDNGQEFKLVVRTTKKGDTEKQVIDLSDQVPKQYSLPIEVRTNSSRNFESIQNIINVQKAIMLEKYDSFQMIGYNPQEDAISISFYEPDLGKQNEIKANLKQLSDMKTSIKFLPEPLAYTAGPTGGGEIYTSDTSSLCSGGFTGTMNGKLGILTATHCVIKKDPNNQLSYVYKPLSYYTNTNLYGGSPTYTFGQPIIPESIYHEIAFLPFNTNSISGKVQTSIEKGKLTALQTITGIGKATPGNNINGKNIGGTPVCSIGRSSGYKCGTVTSITSGADECNSSALGKITKNACSSTYIVVEGPDYRVNKGDSGGPLFDSKGNAYGIASAGSAGGGNIGIFSSLSYLSGFTLKIGE